MARIGPDPSQQNQCLFSYLSPAFTLQKLPILFHSLQRASLSAPSLSPKSPPASAFVTYVYVMRGAFPSFQIPFSSYEESSLSKRRPSRRRNPTVQQRQSLYAFLLCTTTVDSMKRTVEIHPSSVLFEKRPEQEQEHAARHHHAVKKKKGKKLKKKGWGK